MKRVALLLAVLLCATSVYAQPYVRLQPTRTSGTIDITTTSLTLAADALGAFGSVKVQTLDSYSGTWEVQCSLDGTNFDADNELKITPVDSVTVAYSVSDDVGIFDITNAVGCRAIRVIATAGFAASDTSVIISATQLGGGSAGGGGAGGAGTEFLEDAAHSSGDAGTMMLGVQKAACGTASAATGDYVTPQFDADGNLCIAIDAGAAAATQYLEDDAHASGDAGMLSLGVRNANCGTALSGANGDYNALQTDANGNLCINIATNSVGSTTDTDDGTVAAAQDSVALVLTFPMVFDGTNWSRRQGFHLVDDAAFTPATDGVAVAGFTADETATDSVTEGDAGAARMTLDRKVITTPYPHTAGGLAIHRSIDLDEGTGEVVKGSPGQVYGFWVTNIATTTRWIKFYNATSCTIGTGTPVLTIGIPGNATDNISGSFGPGGMGIEFTTGICVGAVTGAEDANTGAPGASDVVVDIFYK